MGTRAKKASEREWQFLTALRDLTPYTMPGLKFSESGHAAVIFLHASKGFKQTSPGLHITADALLTQSMVESWNDKHAFSALTP